MPYRRCSSNRIPGSWFVLGDPNGTRVWIMDRTGRPGDRLRPAQEILEWYGYDLSRMEGA